MGVDMCCLTQPTVLDTARLFFIRRNTLTLLTPYVTIALLIAPSGLANLNSIDPI
jgi:hypothetical protein